MELYPYQKRLSEATEKEVLLVGGVGVGIRTALLTDALLKASAGNNVVILAEYQWYLTEYAIPMFERVLYPFQSSTVDLIRESPSFRSYQHCGGGRIDFTSRKKLSGQELTDYGYVWEASELGNPLTTYDTLISKCRCGVRVVGNTRGHNWFWKLFVEGNPDGDTGVLVDDRYEYRKGERLAIRVDSDALGSKFARTEQSEAVGV